MGPKPSVEECLHLCWEDFESGFVKGIVKVVP